MTDQIKRFERTPYHLKDWKESLQATEENWMSDIDKVKSKLSCDGDEKGQSGGIAWQGKEIDKSDWRT